jgi:hypothetical protein
LEHPGREVHEPRELAAGSNTASKGSSTRALADDLGGLVGRYVELLSEPLERGRQDARGRVICLGQLDGRRGERVGDSLVIDTKRLSRMFEQRGPGSGEAA